jgi:hypothetical protein
MIRGDPGHHCSGPPREDGGLAMRVNEKQEEQSQCANQILAKSMARFGPSAEPTQLLVRKKRSCPFRNSLDKQDFLLYC